MTHVGQMSKHENPRTDPGVASFCFQFSNCLFSFKKLLPAYIEFYTELETPRKQLKGKLNANIN